MTTPPRIPCTPAECRLVGQAYTHWERRANDTRNPYRPLPFDHLILALESDPHSMCANFEQTLWERFVLEAVLDFMRVHEIPELKSYADAVLEERKAESSLVAIGPLTARMEPLAWWETISPQRVSDWWSACLQTLDQLVRKPSELSFRALRGDRTALRKDDLKAVPGEVFEIFVPFGEGEGPSLRSLEGRLLRARAFYEPRLTAFVWFSTPEQDIAVMGTLVYSERMSHWKAHPLRDAIQLPTPIGVSGSSKSD